MSDTPKPSESDLSDLLGRPPAVINVGLEGFADELRQQDVDCVHVDWAPPAGGDPELARLLSKLGS